jgi:hypothetical protein
MTTKPKGAERDSQPVELSTVAATTADFIARAEVAAYTPGGPRAAYYALGRALGIKGGGLPPQELTDAEQEMFSEARRSLGDKPARDDATRVVGLILDNAKLRGDERRNTRKKLMRRFGFEV